eukprot:1195450-Prorocentrum_minimum.AAC.3
MSTLPSLLRRNYPALMGEWSASLPTMGSWGPWGTPRPWGEGSRSNRAIGQAGGKQGCYAPGLHVGVDLDSEPLVTDALRLHEQRAEPVELPLIAAHPVEVDGPRPRVGLLKIPPPRHDHSRPQLNGLYDGHKGSHTDSRPHLSVARRQRYLLISRGQTNELAN